ncbi:hypothetical protein [Ferrovibrio sp.]|uniref:hypothetical protein n=1 Tax=Ferrovibrio sp. TaxID=1917215 RepID=UPI003D28023A
MKFGVLKSIGHNIADSLASGNGFLIGVYSASPYQEVKHTSGQPITVDFLSGLVTEGQPSAAFAKAVSLYSQTALDELCKRQGAERAVFSTLKVRFGIAPAHSLYAVVIVEDQKGRRSEELYVGQPLRKPRRK